VPVDMPFRTLAARATAVAKGRVESSLVLTACRRIRARVRTRASTTALRAVRLLLLHLLVHLLGTLRPLLRLRMVQPGSNTCRVSSAVDLARRTLLLLLDLMELPQTASLRSSPSLLDLLCHRLLRGHLPLLLLLLAPAASAARRLLPLRLPCRLLWIRVRTDKKFRHLSDLLSTTF